MPIRDREDAAEVEAGIARAFGAAPEERAAAIRQLFVEVLDFNPAQGQVSLASASAAVELPDAAELVALLEGVHVLHIALEGSQPPLLSPSSLASAEAAAFDDPVAGETLVLLAAGDIHGCYAVGDKLEPRSITPAQLVAAAECQPETPAQPLPNSTNERVMAAFKAFQREFGQRLGRARRPRNTRARRYVSRQLRATREATDDPAEIRQIDVLSRVFNGDLPPQVESALGEISNLQLQGRVLRIRLEALRERFRLSVPDDSHEGATPEPEAIRIVCSDGLK